MAHRRSYPQNAAKNHSDRFLSQALRGTPIHQNFETGAGMIGESAIIRHATLHIDGHTVNASIRYRVDDTTQPPVLTMSALEGATFSFDLHEGVACLD